MDKRTCPFCGKPVIASLNRCPHCREAMPAVTVTRGRGSAESSGNIRRGLLWAVLAGVIYYFAGGHSGLKLPFDVPNFVNQFLTPLMFVAGAAMALYGVFQNLRS
jgi:hypothetical protein